MRESHDFLSIVVPLRDEEDNVLPLATQVQAALAGAPWPWQLILVDDGSRDRTSERIREAVAACPRHLSGAILRRGFGQTAAMQAGIDLARGTVIATLDGDLQNNPHDIVRMVRRLLDEDLDLLVGWRRARRDGLWRRLPSRLGNRLIGLLTGVPLHDYGCTLKVYRAAVLRRVRLYGEMHRFIPSWMATLTSPDRIREEEVSHFPRRHGRSKYGASGLGRAVKVLLDLLTMAFFVRFRASPGHFFGRIGLTCGGAGLAVLGWLTWQKLGEGAAIAGRPLLLLGILLVVIGVQFVCTGILTEMLARTWFEAGGAPAYVVRETVGGAGEEVPGHEWPGHEWPAHQRPRPARERP
ncbi:glycosyltransferase family 2 protein [Telluria mixta]|uniref:Glycosyltransferase family 2 protein n=1 Tax=Telluria mixta TaxID=34071 RepID=A0ABT2C3L0_9BURK|nr:glycosyltransferase family 2 protein [Telluria mixta]MCS0631972.1 glycosyltransferase family 2 protein [Telluria mixta]WEM95349.1 glycosyltransferase family 2 protein [Telluria mixta]